MTARVRPHVPALLGALLGLAALLWVGPTDFGWSDYDVEAAPAFRALVDGHVSEFLLLAPSYGGSLVLRAPVVALTSLLGGGEVAAWRAGSLLCMLAAAGLGVGVVARMRAASSPWLWRAVVLALLTASPLALRAFEIGHPEEILGGALCVAAVVVAGRRRALCAGVLLGLAIATKGWGLLAVGPALLLLDGRRLRTLVVAGVTCAAIVAPLSLAHPSSFAAKAQGMSTTGHIFEVTQAWWFLSGEKKTVRINGTLRENYRVAPAWINRVTHPLIILVALPLSALLLFVRRRRVGPGDALLLLALLLHLRCLLDTWNLSYYAVPFLLALVSWEALHTRRPPVLGLLATASVWALFEELPRHVSTVPDVQAAAYLAWALPVAAGLALRLYAPAVWRRTIAALDVGPVLGAKGREAVAPAR